MQNKNIFYLNYNFKTISMLILLTILPNLLGMINLPIVFGFKIHLFQYAIFIAAMTYGPLGGLISGGFGSMFSAFVMHNPYIVVGNMILGFVIGLLVRKKLNIILAVLIAYTIQMPWLFVTDVYLVGMPISVVYSLMIALLISNIIWAVAAKYTLKWNGKNFFQD